MREIEWHGETKIVGSTRLSASFDVYAGKLVSRHLFGHKAHTDLMRCKLLTFAIILGTSSIYTWSLCSKQADPCDQNETYHTSNEDKIKHMNETY